MEFTKKLWRYAGVMLAAVLGSVLLGLELVGAGVARMSQQARENWGFAPRTKSFSKSNTRHGRREFYEVRGTYEGPDNDELEVVLEKLLHDVSFDLRGLEDRAADYDEQPEATGPIGQTEQEDNSGNGEATRGRETITA